MTNEGRPIRLIFMTEKDGCEICQGENGGVPGNENIIGGLTVCDYCTSAWMDYRDGLKFVLSEYDTIRMFQSKERINRAPHKPSA